MQYIEVPTGEDAAKKIINSHNKGEPLPIFDVLIFLAWLTTLGVTVANNLKLKQMPVEDVITAIKPEDIEQRHLIEKLLTEMRVMIGCDRVVLGIFHNGVRIGGTNHFKKFSVIYEDTAPGIGSIKSLIQNIPATKIYAEVEEAINSRESKFIAVNKAELIDPGCITHLDSIGVEHLIHRIFFNSDGAYGIMHLQWIESPTELITSIDIASLEKIFHRLETRLEYVVKNKKIPRKFRKTIVKSH